MSASHQYILSWVQVQLAEEQLRHATTAMVKVETETFAELADGPVELALMSGTYRARLDGHPASRSIVVEQVTFASKGVGRRV